MNFTGGLVVDAASAEPVDVLPGGVHELVHAGPGDPLDPRLRGQAGPYMGQPGNTVFPVAVILLTEAAGIRGQFEEIIGGAKAGQEIPAGPRR